MACDQVRASALLGSWLPLRALNYGALLCFGGGYKRVLYGVNKDSEFEPLKCNSSTHPFPWSQRTHDRSDNNDDAGNKLSSDKNGLK